MLYVRLVVGPNAFQAILSRREQRHQLKRVGTVQSLMFFVYPVYQVLFTKVSGTNYELPVPCYSSSVEVDFCIRRCQEGGHDPSSSCVHRRFLRLVLLCYVYSFRVFVDTRSGDGGGFNPDSGGDVRVTPANSKISHRLHRLGVVATNDYGSLLVAVRALCSTMQATYVQVENRIQVRSCIYHQLSEEGRLLLTIFERFSSAGSAINSFQQNFRTISSVAFVANLGCAGRSSGSAFHV